MNIKELNDKLTVVAKEWKDNLNDTLVVVADNGTGNGCHIITANASVNDEFTVALTIISHAFRGVRLEDVEKTKTAVAMAVVETLKHVADK